MSLLSYNSLSIYWSTPLIEANIVVFFHLLGSLFLGLLLGFERSYHGRAAGMRTYGLVCLASTALIVIIGYPQYWFGTQLHYQYAPDMTRVIQGIVTGIGFLGAGVIIKEGFTISGLSTAASIWSASAIGILVGIGFYFAAILLTLMSAIIMMWGYKLEAWLPSRQAIAISLTYKKNYKPEESDLAATFLQCNYSITEGTIAINSTDDTQSWCFHVVSLKKTPHCSITEISHALDKLNNLENYSIAFARN